MLAALHPSRPGVQSQAVLLLFLPVTLLAMLDEQRPDLCFKERYSIHVRRRVNLRAPAEREANGFQ
jgi:hypothetical protein